eukprot:Pgem_evm16s12025
MNDNNKLAAASQSLFNSDESNKIISNSLCNPNIKQSLYGITSPRNDNFDKNASIIINNVTKHKYEWTDDNIQHLHKYLKEIEQLHKYKRKDNVSQGLIMLALGFVSAIELFTLNNNISLSIQNSLIIISGIMNIMTMTSLAIVRYMKWHTKSDFSKVVLIMSQDLQAEISNAINVIPTDEDPRYYLIKLEKKYQSLNNVFNYI